MDVFRLQWATAVETLGCSTHAAQLCVHFVAHVCDADEEVASLTHGLVLLERLMLRGHTLTHDALCGCVLLAVQMTVDEDLAPTTELRLLLGVTRKLHDVQVGVLEPLGFRTVVSRAEFTIYRNALSTAPVQSNPKCVISTSDLDCH